MRNYVRKFTFARPKMKRAPRRSRGALEVLLHARRNGEVQAEPGLVHPAHAAARTTAVSTCACSGLLVVFPDVGHQSFGGEHQAGNRCGILEREARDLGWVDYARLDQVAELSGIRVEAEVVFLAFTHTVHDYGAFVARVQGNLPQGFLERALDDIHADGFFLSELEFVEHRDAADQCYSAASDDAFLDCRAGGVHGVFDASFLFFQLGFGCRAHLDHRYAADQFRKPLLQLFLVVVRGGFLDLRADLPDASFDFARLATAFDDRGVVLIDCDFLGPAEVFHLHVLELDAQILGDGLAACECGDVFEHGLAAVAEAGRFYRGALQRTPQLVHHQGRQGFALDVLSDDQQRLAQLGNLFEKGKQVLHRADFLFVDQDARVFEHAFHPFGVGDKVGGEVAAVELHSFDHFERGLHGPRFLDGDDAVLAYLLHGFGDDAADLSIVVGGNRADLRDHVAVVVPSPATSEVFDATSRTICAPMFSSGSCSSISFATVTPSLVMIGAPNFFSITAFRPLGPSVIFTASARALTPRRIDWREFSPVTICFAISVSPLLNFLLDFQMIATPQGCSRGKVTFCRTRTWLRPKAWPESRLREESGSPLLPL